MDSGLRSMTTWWRSVLSGTSTPIARSRGPDHGPAATTTSRVSVLPPSVTTADTPPPETSMPVTFAPATTLAPISRARFAYPVVTEYGSA